MAKVKNFKTVFPAVSVPLNEDYSINEAEFRVYLRWIKSFYGKGIEGLVCNGHTGEITGLTRAERKRVVEICAEECGDVMTIISGVNCENTQESIEMAAEAKAAGADAALSVTGIAGPGGGTAEKPVGLVYAGCYVKGHVRVEEFYFTGNREKNRESAVARALTLLREELIGRK